MTAAAAIAIFLSNININMLNSVNQVNVVTLTAATAADWIGVQSQKRLRRLYICITTYLLPGPRSWSYFFTPVLLPLILLTPPRILSHYQIQAVVFPLMIASTVHAWIAMECVDVASLNILLWSAFLLAFNDARRDFVRRTPKRSLLASVTTAWGVCSKKRKSDNLVSQTETKKASLHGGNAEDSKPLRCLTKPRSTETCSTESYPTGMLSRLDWVVCLIYSTRMQGWLRKPPQPHTTTSTHGCTQKHASHLLPPPPPSKTPRIQFVTTRLSHAVLNLCSLTMVLSVALTDPWFDQPHLISISSPLPEQGILFRPWRSARHLLRPWLVRPLVIGGYIYNFVTLPYNLYSPFVVLSNYVFGLPPDEWSPHRLSPYFGSFVSGVLEGGIAGFWGTWWHQQMRVFYSGPGYAAADALQLRKHGSVARYLLLVFSAFFFSGITHMGLVPKLPILLLSEFGDERLVIKRAWLLRFKIAAFFWLQPFGIAFELGLNKALLEALLLSRSLMHHRHATIFSRAIRFLCVALWLCVTLPLFAEPLAELGYWQIWRTALMNLEMFLCAKCSGLLRSLTLYGGP